MKDNVEQSDRSIAKMVDPLEHRITVRRQRARRCIRLQYHASCAIGTDVIGVPRAGGLRQHRRGRSAILATSALSQSLTCDNAPGMLSMDPVTGGWPWPQPVHGSRLNTAETLASTVSMRTWAAAPPDGKVHRPCRAIGESGVEPPIARHATARAARAGRLRRNQ
jgi:hypothetical protein